VEDEHTVPVRLVNELETAHLEPDAARSAITANESAAKETRAALRSEHLANSALRRALASAEERIHALEQQLAAMQLQIAAAAAVLDSRRSNRPARDPARQTNPLEPLSRPIREADRRPFHEQVQVRVDGEAALLVDLSTRGAQIVTKSSVKPNRSVKILLALQEKAISCNGQVVWARIEPSAAPGSLRYRAGMLFTNADENAIEVFMTGHSEMLGRISNLVTKSEPS
jgi:hypothetical protein